MAPKQQQPVVDEAVVAKHKRGLAQANGALLDDPKHLQALHVRALCLAVLGRHDEAERAYARALEASAEQDPKGARFDLVAPSYGHARELALLERPDDAREALDVAVTFDPKAIERAKQDAAFFPLFGAPVAPKKAPAARAVKAWKPTDKRFPALRSALEIDDREAFEKDYEPAALEAWPTAKGNDTAWPLVLAATDAGAHEILAFLLERGADPNAATSDARHWTSLMRAVAVNDRRAVELLLKAGADPTAETDVGAGGRDTDSVTPIAYAHRKGHDDLAAMLRAAKSRR